MAFGKESMDLATEGQVDLINRKLENTYHDLRDVLQDLGWGDLADHIGNDVRKLSKANASEVIDRLLEIADEESRDRRGGRY